jgi:hypothetical protein
MSGARSLVRHLFVLFGVERDRAGLLGITAERDLLGRAADPHFGSLALSNRRRLRSFPVLLPKSGGPVESALTGVRFSLVWLHPVPGL